MRATIFQVPMMLSYISHEIARDMEAIDGILHENRFELRPLVQKDLLDNGTSDALGRNGLNADQVLRLLVVKQMHGLSYRKLEFHLEDSRTFRTFCRFGFGDSLPGKSSIQANIRRLSEHTLERINTVLVDYAKSQSIEDGEKLRVDCTVVESDIHPPCDASLLADSVRVLCRFLGKLRETYDIKFEDHTRKARRIAFKLKFTKAKKQKRTMYETLINLTLECIGYAKCAISYDGILEQGIGKDLERFSGLAERVVVQTVRRVFLGENVPASEKVVSIFEPHTDIIVKDGRTTYFGHKICISTGSSLLVTDCQILDGNPADSTLAVDSVKRHLSTFGDTPRQVVFDGGFASSANLSEIKDMGLHDVVFSKHAGITVSDMVDDRQNYKDLLKFRSGIEACISFLKRCFGLGRCKWRNGFSSFKSYVWASILSSNLLTLARKRGR